MRTTGTLLGLVLYPWDQWCWQEHKVREQWLEVRRQGQGLVNWSSRILEDKDFIWGQQHCWDPMLSLLTFIGNHGYSQDSYGFPVLEFPRGGEKREIPMEIFATDIIVIVLMSGILLRHLSHVDRDVCVWTLRISECDADVSSGSSISTIDLVRRQVRAVTWPRLPYVATYSRY